MAQLTNIRQANGAPVQVSVLGMGLVNERRRYNVTSSFNGWAHTQNDPCRYIDAYVPH